MTQGVKFEKNYSESDISHKLKPNFEHEILEYAFYFIRVFIVVSLVFSFIRSFVFYTIGIDGNSMVPTLRNNEIVYLDLLTPHFSSYQRGDIVVLKPPGYNKKDKNHNKLYIKRIVALPGEKISFKNDFVYISNDNYPDGIKLKENYLDPTTRTYKSENKSDKGYEGKELVKNEYYVMGDNRTQSQDSRSFGSIEKNQIVGKVFFVDSKNEKKHFFSLPVYNIAN
jgi:signal peptidase I